MSDNKRKVLVLGLDCAEPTLVFDQYLDQLPNLRLLMRQGMWGRLATITPPITVPAWACALTSRDPGQLGVYGFENRANHSYGKMSTANARTITDPAVWAYLGHAGKQSYLIGVPPSFPPKPINGGIVGCFLSPSVDSRFTYPDSLRNEIADVVPDYMVDVPDFRTTDKHALLGRIYDMTDGHFQLARHLMKTKPWDFLMFVEIGLDRLQHGFWKYHDPEHLRHEPAGPFENSIRDYYVWLDGQVGTLLELIDDDTCVIVMSDHGAKKLNGGISLNEWLFEQGYLVLKSQPDGVIPFEQAQVNWSKTKAWASGGYVGKIFLNMRGREPQGAVPRELYDSVRDELIDKLSTVQDPHGKRLATHVYKPKDIYRSTKNIPPDLIVILDDLSWRAVGSIGSGEIYASDTDMGPDGANHSETGIFIYYDMKHDLGGRQLDNLCIYDIAPTVLHEFNYQVPPQMIGRVIKPQSGPEEGARQASTSFDPFAQTLLTAL